MYASLALSKYRSCNIFSLQSPDRMFVSGFTLACKTILSKVKIFVKDLLAIVKRAKINATLTIKAKDPLSFKKPT